ncbi:MAG: hypothetical protein DWQ01_00235 [Planctomycetota bacterium]|nr:MAG: hypothetical protein DWQ01_00235 [Planctomycetota bacterium]
MSESFTLQGETSKGGSRPGKGRKPVLALFLVVAAAGILWKMFQNRPLQTGSGTSLYQEVEARRVLMEQLLPGSKIPEPFVIRGAMEKGGMAALWLSFDGLGHQAFLFGGESLPNQQTVQDLTVALAGQPLPTRRIVDGEGVLPERLPPFTEEFRQRDPVVPQVQPLQGWEPEWPKASSFQLGGPASDITVRIQVAEGREFPISAYRQQEKHWWCLADLSAASPKDSLILLHALKTQNAPNTDALIDFVREMLRLDSAR